MIWAEKLGGLALYVNGRLVGWVTSTINGQYMHGVIAQTPGMKTPSATRDEAKQKLLNAIGD